MITCNLLGGLGNQLFQIFTTISYAMDCGNNPAFLNTPNTIGITYRNTYWNTFFISLQKWIYPSLNPYFPILREKAFHYNELPVIKEPVDISLAGYFQSYKYFDQNKYKITELICLNRHKIELKKRIQINFDKTISIHFRIGDYKMLQDKHPILKDIYYYNALQYILQKIKTNTNTNKEEEEKISVLYFYEENDLLDVNKQILQLSKQFQNITFVPINQIFQDWEQLIIMSCCKYNIIANSTFSWWGAYLNEAYDNIVCYPSVWFGPALNHDTKDLFPTDWIKIDS